MCEIAMPNRKGFRESGNASDQTRMPPDFQPDIHITFQSVVPTGADVHL